MFTSKRLLSGLLLAGLSACPPEKVEPELTLSASPRTIDGAMQATTIKVVGVDDNAKPGTGNVRVTSAAGSLKDGTDVALVAGEGTVDFTCNRATDPACNNVVRVTAEWIVSGETITANTNVTIAPAPIPDAGSASISVTATPARFDVGSGTSTIVATYIADTVPGANAAVTLATNLGTLLAIDGGTFVNGPSDSMGQVHALLIDNGSPGVATVTATGPRATPATTDVTFDPRDAGPPVDGGYSVTLTADKNQIIAGVGDATILTATLQSVSNTNGIPVTFTTSVGRLGPVGGSGVASSYIATSDGGVAQAQLLAGSADTGQAVVTAQLATNGGATSNNVTVNIVNVSQISFISTECPQTITNCNLMGLQGSGFNETALVKFKVTDGTGAGVSGVAVNFALVGAPTGTTVDPMGTTNAMGEVRANVRAGRTIGTFTVTATALGMFTVTSPTIGVRGAKPSNRGFLLRCDRVNIPVYASSTPPLPLMVNCQVGLSDRYGNPIGTGTQVRLNSEAGQVPNNVATTPFMPGVTAEGFGSFSFNTALNFPALDVPPLTANATQYPVPLVTEPSIPGTIVRNPRDGLVTVIAYLQGEEDFKDDNANGTRDANEQFIDQGEPFVDSNDNNQWDTGETFVDTPPADGGVPNGMWDGPNGTWDSNAQIWTEYRLLYTGPTSSSNCVLTTSSTRTPSGFGTLFTNTSMVLRGFTPDLHLNRVEGGSGVTARFQPATRGSTAVVNSNIGLDGYGFGYQRILVNPTGTGPCATTEPVCRWKVLFGDWDEGGVADVQLTGAAPPAMPITETAIIETNVRGILGACGSTGTVE